MKLKIVKDDIKSLREKSIDVNTPLTKEDHDLSLALLDYVKLSQNEDYLAKHPNVKEGVGLAAPQIGVNKKLIAISIPGEDKSTDYLLANPKIISMSVKRSYLQYGEGCLSVDNKHEGRVYRYYKITVKAFDILKNKEVVIVERGFNAIVLQHEIDHLSGILFYDRIDKTHPFKEMDNSVAI